MLTSEFKPGIILYASVLVFTDECSDTVSHTIMDTHGATSAHLCTSRNSRYNDFGSRKNIINNH